MVARKVPKKCVWVSGFRRQPGFSDSALLEPFRSQPGIKGARGRKNNKVLLFFNSEADAQMAADNLQLIHPGLRFNLDTENPNYYMQYRFWTTADKRPPLDTPVGPDRPSNTHGQQIRPCVWLRNVPIDMCKTNVYNLLDMLGTRNHTVTFYDSNKKDCDSRSVKVEIDAPDCKTRLMDLTIKINRTRPQKWNGRDISAGYLCGTTITACPRPTVVGHPCRVRRRGGKRGSNGNGFRRKCPWKHIQAGPFECSKCRPQGANPGAEPRSILKPSTETCRRMFPSQHALNSHIESKHTNPKKVRLSEPYRKAEEYWLER